MGCAVQICSMLHQRYAEFSPELLGQLQKIYSTGISKDEDKVEREISFGCWYVIISFCAHTVCSDNQV